MPPKLADHFAAGFGFSVEREKRCCEMPFTSLGENQKSKPRKTQKNGEKMKNKEKEKKCMSLKIYAKKQKRKVIEIKIIGRNENVSFIGNLQKSLDFYVN